MSLGREGKGHRMSEGREGDVTDVVAVVYMLDSGCCCDGGGASVVNVTNGVVVSCMFDSGPCCDGSGGRTSVINVTNVVVIIAVGCMLGNGSCYDGGVGAHASVVTVAVCMLVSGCYCDVGDGGGRHGRSSDHYSCRHGHDGHGRSSGPALSDDEDDFGGGGGCGR